MGNTGSTDAPVARLVSTSVSQQRVAHYFRKHAKESLSNVELITLSNTLFGAIKPLDTVIPYNDFLGKLGIAVKSETIDDPRYLLLKTILKRLANWPFINRRETSPSNDFTLHDIIVLVYLLYKNGFAKLGLGGDYLIKLIFHVACLGESTYEKKTNVDVNVDDDDRTIDIIMEGKKVRWDLLPVVQSFDIMDGGAEIDDEMTKSQLNVLFSLLLPLSMLKYSEDAFHEKHNYQTSISALMKTLYMGNLGKETINSTLFVDNYNTFTPHLFEPFQNMFEPIIVGYKDKNDGNKLQGSAIPKNSGSAFTLSTLAQLATTLDSDEIDLLCKSTSGKKPLYKGSQNGYSINSVQTHTLNYRAHTVLLISGRIISDGSESHNNNFFARFPKFHPVAEEEQRETQEKKQKQKFQMAVILTTPWRITNTKTFGDCDFKIVQLSPIQTTFIGENGRPCDYAYFSNMGLGIGFGSKPPIKSKDVRQNQIKFQLGGVSLTLDSSLERGNFRVEDISRHGSSYGLYSGAGGGKSNVHCEMYRDEWFKINELEIYGLGDANSLAEQRRAHEWEEREAERRRGLNSDYAESRALLELEGLVGGASSGGSV